MSKCLWPFAVATLLIRTSPGQILMNVSTQPSSGVAGSSVVNAIGSGFPVGRGDIDPSSVTISLASSCGGQAIEATLASSVKSVIGTQSRASFLVPASLVAGTYSVTLSGSTSDGTRFQSASGSCSEIAVTHTTSTLSACAPSSSLGLYAPPAGGKVTAYAPNGCWNCTKTGIQAVVIEGGSGHTAIETPGIVNSCSSNPGTGKTVCVANNTDVYVINGTSLSKTLQSASDADAPLSGGECHNCGVAMNPIRNEAVITMGLRFGVSSPSHSGFQVLDLNTDQLSSPFPSRRDISENIAIDSFRGYILSPNEGSNYDIYSFNNSGVITEFANQITPGEALDAGAEDCSTGIALATSESSVGLYITDLTQAKFTPGLPGSWTAPQQILRLADSGGTGIAVAQGPSHLGIITAEFVNGGPFTVVQLPATSGTGTPNIVDYAVAGIPGFIGTADPHTVTAYTSPNDGKAYGLMSSGVPATALAQIDLACIMALPRVAGRHIVSGSASACVRIIPTGNALLAPPSITSVPITTAAVGQFYQYSVRATDAYTYSFSFDLPVAPAGMQIDPKTGLIAWTPGSDQVGIQNVTVHVQNIFGASVSQTFQVNVTGVANRPPVITSTPPSSVVAGQTYTYPVRASDPGGATLSFFLIAAPSDMTINAATGMIQWSPAKGLAGNTASVTVLASNPSRLSASQMFQIAILSPENHPPVITSTPGITAVVGQRYTYQARAADPDNDPVAFSFISAPLGMTIDPNTGLVAWSPSSADLGDWNVSLRAQDPGRLVGTQAFKLHVQRAYPLPSITISSPAPGTVLNGPVDIIANISDPSGGGPPIDWTVDLVRADGKQTRRVGSGSGAVSNVGIAHIDPTIVRDDSYSVVVTVSKLGQVDSAQFGYSVFTGDLKLGNFRTSFTDISIPVAGIPLEITRTYDSIDTAPGEFGAGWHLGLPGNVVDSVQAIPLQAFTPRTRVYVTRPDGKREGFTFDPIPPTLLQIFWQPRFRPDPGVTDSLATDAAVLSDTGTGFYEFLGGPYKPTRYTLTTTQGVQYVIDEVAGLLRITDRNGNTLDVTPTGLQSSTGLSLPFEKDSEGRITRITEPGGNSARYVYENGNLASSFDQMGNETKYFYEASSFPNYLTRVQDPLGRPVTRNVFNGAGKLVAQCDANGNVTTLAGCVQFDSNADVRLQTVINARGYKTELLTDDRGNVLTEKRYTDNFQHVDTVRTYDANNNLLTTTDPAGNVTSSTYDARSNQLTQTDSGGHTRTFTYNSCDLVATDKDAGGSTTTYTYDAQCNLRFIKDALGAVTEYQYNGAGQRTALIDPLGSTWKWTYDNRGFPASRTDPFGKVTTYQYSASGDLLSQTDRIGRHIEFQYDLDHNVAREVWSSGRAETFAYDTAGELTTLSDRDSSLIIGYDSVGRIRTTENQGTTGSPRVVLTTSYDQNGNVTSVQDSLGGTTAYGYDFLDRFVNATQSGPGLQPKRVDLLYDPANTPIEVRRFADLSGSNPVAKTIYKYECGGCSNRVSSIHHRRSSDNSVLHDLEFTRDAVGNVTVMQDANGSHDYAYDIKRRLVKATHPAAAFQPNEFYTYDRAGNRLTSHISSQYKYSYQTSGAGNRLLQDANFDYKYDDEGNLALRTDRSNGSSTEYSYDLRNRLIGVAVKNRDGVQIDGAIHTYDGLNRLIESVEGSKTEIFVYDVMNPVLKLTASGAIIDRRFYGLTLDSVLAEEIGNVTQWSLTDQTPTLRDIISNSTTTVARREYDSFGNNIANSGSSPQTALQFVGRETLLGSGLLQLRNRDYDPSIGRFTQEDLFEAFNYVYGADNPISFWDPLGLAEQPTLVQRVSQTVRSIAGKYGCAIIGAIALAGVAIYPVDAVSKVPGSLGYDSAQALKVLSDYDKRRKLAERCK